MKAVKVLIASLVMVLVFAPKTFAVGPQMWIILHHEAQGVSDQSFTQCMPDDSWSGHEDHIGDTQQGPYASKEECEEALVPIIPEFGALTGALAFLSSGSAFYFLKRKI